MRNALPYYDAGFTAQVSVIPPGGSVSPNSTLDQKDAGKAPGKMNYQGQYVGYPWMKYQPSRDDVALWVSQGSNIGFGAWEYPAIDVDIVDHVAAKAVEERLLQLFGPCLIRVGQAPKALLIFRSDEPLRSFDIRFTRTNPLLGTEEHQLVQFLGQGRQYVMDGIHPVTRQPYQIHDPLHALSLLGPQALPVLTMERVVEAFKAIEEVMVGLGYTASTDAEARATAGDVSQEELKAPNMEVLAELVSTIPNETPDRHEYVAVGYAIKGASQDDPGAGLDIFQEWCSRWTQGHNSPEQVSTDWEKMAPPYRAGYPWLLSKGKAWGADVSIFEFGAAEAQPEPGSAPQESAAKSDEEGSSGRWSDIDLAERFTKAFTGHLLYVPESTNEYRWDGKRWVIEAGQPIQAEVIKFLKRETAKMMASVETPSKQAELAMKLGGRRTLDNVRALVVSSNGVRGNLPDLDADPDVLNTPVGAYNLANGEWLPSEVAQRCLKATSVAPAGIVHCPRWLQFLEESMQGDRDAIEHLQILAGNALTGHTRDQRFPFFLGAGGNGKSVFINVLQHIMGDYFKSAPSELFQATKGGIQKAPEYTLAMLAGARLVATNETKLGATWDEQRIKQLTGDDIISARLPYGKPFEFRSQATLIVVGNYSPELETVTPAITRRMYLVPWNNRPVSPDRDLMDKLEVELPSILTWCMEGARKWYTLGLSPPASIMDATQEYFAEQDHLGQWAEACLAPVDRQLIDEVPVVSSRELYDSYNMWRTENFGPHYKIETFAKLVGTALAAMGARKFRNSKVRGWRGIMVKEGATNAPSNVVPFTAVAPKG